jgi:hypothetical protein
MGEKSLIKPPAPGGISGQKGYNMSAYIVSKEHIIYLVTAAHRIDRLNRCGGYTNLPCDASILWQENVLSVNARYPGDKSDHALYTIEEKDIPGIIHLPDLGQLAKAVHCYEYQSCEHDGWEDSEAFAWCEKVKYNILQALPGYQNAVWGCPKDKKGEVIK